MASNEIKLIFALFALEHLVGLIVYFLFGLNAAIIAAFLILAIGLVLPFILVKYVARSDGYLVNEISRRINKWVGEQILRNTHTA